MNELVLSQLGLTDIELGQSGVRRAVTTRCPACQLQLCKSREALPHAHLKAADSNVVPHGKVNKAHHALYMCDTCATVLVHSLNVIEPGWRQQR